MSTSRSLLEIERFVMKMRKLGASSVGVGEVVVTFDAADEGPPPAPEIEPKKQVEDLLYASSD